MPTDFVAKWIMFLGRTTYLTSNLPEPMDPEDRDHFRLLLGMTVLCAIAVGLLAFVASYPAWAQSLIGIFLHPEKDSWLIDTLSAVVLTSMLILAAPHYVGFFYRLRVLKSQAYFPISLIGIMVLAFVAFVWVGPWPVILSVVPMFVYFCPPLPKLHQGSKGKDTSAPVKPQT